MERMKDLTQQYVEQLNSIIKDLREEKFKLVEENERLKEENKNLTKYNLNLQEWLDNKEKLNEGYRKEIKDHQLYEEKLEHRIIEFEELLHGE